MGQNKARGVGIENEIQPAIRRLIKPDLCLTLPAPQGGFAKGGDHRLRLSPLQGGGGGGWAGALAPWDAGAAGWGRQWRGSRGLRGFWCGWQTKGSKACPGVTQGLLKPKCRDAGFGFPASRREQ